MKITKNQDGSALNVTLEGRLDTTTAPELEQLLKSLMDNTTDLTLDFGSLVYISSAGLRVLLWAQKCISKRGTLKIRNVSNAIREILEVTGFTDILTIE